MYTGLAESRVAVTSLSVVVFFIVLTITLMYVNKCLINVKCLSVNCSLTFGPVCMCVH